MNYKEQIGDPNFSKPFWIIPLIQMNRFRIKRGKLHYISGEAVENPYMDEITEGLDGFDCFVTCNPWFGQNHEPDFDLDDKFKLLVYDTSLDCNETYDNRYWFHIQLKDDILYNSNPKLRKKSIQIIYKYFVHNEQVYRSCIKHFKSLAWKGAVIIKPEAKYGDESYRYLKF